MWIKRRQKGKVDLRQLTSCMRKVESDGIWWNIYSPLGAFRPVRRFPSKPLKIPLPWRFPTATSAIPTIPINLYTVCVYTLLNIFLIINNFFNNQIWKKKNRQTSKSYFYILSHPRRVYIMIIYLVWFVASQFGHGQIKTRVNAFIRSLSLFNGQEWVGGGESIRATRGANGRNVIKRHMCVRFALYSSCKKWRRWIERAIYAPLRDSFPSPHVKLDSGRTHLFANKTNTPTIFISQCFLFYINNSITFDSKFNYFFSFNNEVSPNCTNIYKLRNYCPKKAT